MKTNIYKWGTGDKPGSLREKFDAHVRPERISALQRAQFFLQQHQLPYMKFVKNDDRRNSVGRVPGS